MRIHSRSSDGIVVVTPDSTVEVDIGNSEQFKEQALQEIGSHPRIVLDASPISFFDSAGMGCLLSLKKQAHVNGGDLVLSGVRPAIHEIFQMIGFDTIFKIYPDVPAAIQDLKEGQP